jgi:TPR repeat protein
MAQHGTSIDTSNQLFAPNDVQSEIDRLSAKFGEPAHLFRMPRREGLPYAIIAVWGKIQLEQLNADDVSVVASGGRHEGILVSFLGDLQRSAKAEVPVYRLAGGAGFLWAATFRNDGRGVLRFLTIDASQITQSSPVAVNPGLQSPTVAPSPPPPQPSELAKIQTAAEKGDAEAQFRLGTIFAEGRRVTKDETQAANWYRKAADQGHAEAQFRLGSMFAEGQGVEKNLVQAIEWVRKAAEQGNIDAKYKLGLMLEIEQGTNIDGSDAFEWYQKAAAAGDPNAKRRIEEAESIVEFLRDMRTKIVSGLPLVQDPETRNQLEDTVARIAAANIKMTLKNLQQFKVDADVAIRKIQQAQDFKSISTSADKREREISAEIEKITSDAPLIQNIKAALQTLKTAQNGSDLPVLQNALAQLNKLYDDNRAELKRLEFYSP